jgi:hypothetical protein
MSNNNINQEYENMKFNHFLKMKYTALMYYKGTPCPQSIHSQEAVNQIKENAEDMIKLGLKNGVSIKTQINDYLSQLDYMEQKLVDSQKKGGNGMYNPNTLNEKELCIWWLNVFALIRLKKLKSDNMNGLSIIDFSGNGMFDGVFKL